MFGKSHVCPCLPQPHCLNNWTRIDICHTCMVCWATNWYALREGCTHSLISQKTSVTDGTVVVPANSFLGAFPSQGRFQPNKHQGCHKNSDLISSLIIHRKCENFSVWHRRFWGWDKYEEQTKESGDSSSLGTEGPENKVEQELKEESGYIFYRISMNFLLSGLWVYLV